MRKRIYLVATAFFTYALTTAAICGESPLPFLESFKSICVDTEGRRDAVENAIERTSGRPRQSKIEGIYYTYRSWDITVAGHPMSVDYTMIRKGDPRDVICGVASERNEDDSISAIIKWVGVAPDTVNSDRQHIARRFRYQEQGNSRSPWPTDQALFGQMLRNGQLHTLQLSQHGTGASVSIHWDIPVRDPSRP